MSTMSRLCMGQVTYADLGDMSLVRGIRGFNPSKVVMG